MMMCRPCGPAGPPTADLDDEQFEGQLPLHAPRLDGLINLQQPPLDGLQLPQAELLALAQELVHDEPLLDLQLLADLMGLELSLLGQILGRQDQAKLSGDHGQDIEGVLVAGQKMLQLAHGA